MSEMPFDRRDVTQALEGAKAAGVQISRVEFEFDPRKIIIVSGRTGRNKKQGWFCTFKHRNTARERAYYYHTKSKRRLHGEPGSPEFIADYDEAEKLLASAAEKVA